MKLRKASHTVYKTQYHIVFIFVTKYRRKILTKGVSQWLRPTFEQLCKYSPDIEFIEVGIDRDHVHLNMVIPPKYAVSQVVNRIKVNTSRQMEQKFSFLEKVYWGTASVWSTGYFVSTVGIDGATIRNYVAMQGREDAGQAELDLGFPQFGGRRVELP
jgi:putative transposase